MSIEAMEPRAAQAAGGQDILKDLWRRRLDTLISGIANGDRYYLQIANAAEHISAEYHGRFLIELIQNANDQAVRQGLTNSGISIIRIEHLIAIGNSGESFDQAKIDSITSIFQSDKTADVCIGNKGIGFKAVFQVADSAEIYSAATNGSLADAPAIAFRMARRPFEDAGFLSEIHALTLRLLKHNDERKRAIEMRFASSNATEAVLHEAGRAAGFTFPLRLTSADFRNRVKQLELSPAGLDGIQTLIILPLDSSVSSSTQVDQAIDDICGCHGRTDNIPAATSILFLPGIGSIKIVDRVRGFQVELEKTEIYRPEHLQGGATLHRHRTSSRRTPLSDLAIVEPAVVQNWWIAERIVGSKDQQDSEKGKTEGEAIREAIQALRLPEENWGDVERVPVSVALPIPVDDDPGYPLGAHGRFCIGLPTQVSTGLPLWVSAHFHGKIDRTAIDFKNNYNALLLNAAVDLSESLLQRIKAFPDVRQKRLVTLAMEWGSGELASRFYAPGGLARQAIVLAANGVFIEAQQLRIPKAADLTMFEVLAEGISDINSHGFCLPDAILLKNARGVLDALAEGTESSDTCYLQRPEACLSLLEHGATKHRADPAFWQKFLKWILERFAPVFAEGLADQAILPTGETELSKSSSRVFFAPLNSAEGTERPHAIDDTEGELAAIDDSVSRLLRFFDDRAITVRTGTARDYTPLAQKLAPSAGGGLVRRPRLIDLLHGALIPALAECRDNNDESLTLLRQALLWLAAMPPKSRKQVRTEKLLVPVCGSDSTWMWVEPDTAYLGKGWAADANIALLTKAYGDRPGSQLVPWDQFAQRASQLFREADPNWWLEMIKEVGVWDCPRIIRSDHYIKVMCANSYSYLSVINGVRCPIPCTDGVWPHYLSQISQRKAQTRNGSDFYLDEVTWIDGLENDSVRTIIVEAMLRRPERYKADQTTILSRRDRKDSGTVPALWIHAIRSEDWDVIPTSHGLRKPHAAWLCPRESRNPKADRFAFLPCVKAELIASRELLSTLGVMALEEAEIPRLSQALQELAEHKERVKPEELRHYVALVHDLYEAIQVRLKEHGGADTLKEILARPIPLFQGTQIACARLSDIVCLYVDDDPVRRRFLTGLDKAWVLPKPSQATYNEIIQALQTLLGAGRVLRVSECAIELPFVPLESHTPLLDYIRRQYPASSITEEVALLIVNGGNRATSPHQNAFRQAWSQIKQTYVVRGTFGEGSLYQSCYDARHKDGPTLLVGPHLRSHEIVAEVWQVLGASYRDIWAAYAEALKDGRTDVFFADRGISLTDRTEVESAIGLGFEQSLRRYQPVCLALWRKNNPHREVDDFHREWASCAHAVEVARNWLQWDNVQAAIELAAHNGEPAGSLALIEKLQLTVPGWQSARRELGFEPYRFEATQRGYEMARRAVVGHLKAWFAYLVVPRASGGHGPIVSPALAEHALTWIEQLCESKVPDDIMELPLEIGAITQRVADEALKLAGDIPAISELPIFIEPLRELSMAAPTDVGALKLKDEPDKAATIYETNDQAARERDAVVAADAVLKVADALASKCGEALDTEAVRHHSLVTLLNRGSWANRVSVLAAVRYALEHSAPNTATRMKERHAFRDVDDWRTIWPKFEELGEISKTATPAPTKLKFDVIGTGWTEEEFAASAAQGPCGDVVRRLAECVKPNLDLAILRHADRQKLAVNDHKTHRKGNGRGTSSYQRVPAAHLEILGAVGEHFFFQQIKELVTDFDLTHWKSKTKEIFGYPAGDDGLGYDFEYYDTQGVIGGNRLAPRCLIEVKSTTRDGTDAFEMTTNEWETAIQCHNGVNQAIYVIARVIRTATQPELLDMLIDPIQLHLDGVLDYTSRNLLVVVGQAQQHD